MFTHRRVNYVKFICVHSFCHHYFRGVSNRKKTMQQKLVVGATRGVVVSAPPSLRLKISKPPKAIMILTGPPIRSHFSPPHSAVAENMMYLNSGTYITCRRRTIFSPNIRCIDQSRTNCGESFIIYPNNRDVRTSQVEHEIGGVLMWCAAAGSPIHACISKLNFPRTHH